MITEAYVPVVIAYASSACITARVVFVIFYVTFSQLMTRRV